MHSKPLQLVSFWGGIALRVTATPYPNPRIDTAQFTSSNIITRDVAIIGGGSGGTYSAISLKDQGKSVIVVEQTNRLGGHTQTYVDPGTGTTIDLGVIMFHDVPVVHDYFARFNIPLIKFGSDADPNAPPIVTAAYDLRSGQPVNATAPTPQAVGAAFTKYAGLLSQWPRLNDGMFLPNPVPDDLLLPFGQFVKKYGIEDVIQTMYNYNPGLGDILTVPTVEEAKNFGLELIQSVASGLLTTKRHHNDELYSKAQAELLGASSVLLNSEVVAADRADGHKGVKLVVKTPQGLKLIVAKKLVIAIPPRLEFLRPFDLSPTERNVFSKFIDGGYYLALVKNTGIPDDMTVPNLAQDTEYNLPVLPAIYSIIATPVPGLKHVFYGAPRTSKTFPLSDNAVKADIIASIKKLQRTNPGKFQQTEPEFVLYKSHAPFYLQAPPQETKNGFYDKLYALQGLRDTYWTGASFRGHDSSDIWRFTKDEVLPKVLAGL